MIKSLYVDTETGGLDELKNPLIEVGMILTIDGKIKDELSFIIKNKYKKTIDQKALDVNGITLEEIDKGIDPKKGHKKIVSALSTYVDKFDRKDKYEFITWNGGIDYRFLNQFFIDNNDDTFKNWIHLPFIDMLPVVRWEFKENNDLKNIPNMKQTTVAKYLGVDLKKYKAHRALDDCRILKDIEEKFRLYKKGKLELKSKKDKR